MKKYRRFFTALCCLYIVLSGYSQFPTFPDGKIQSGIKKNYGKDFKWDIIIDSLEDTQGQLYSKTKMFIGETWKSAHDVIQNDDKEAGLILVKGASVKHLYFALNDHVWTFRYNVKFLLKDYKTRLIIEDVYCDAARCGTWEWPHVPVADQPPNPCYGTTSLSKRQYTKLMTSLKNELQLIVLAWKIAIKTPLIEEAPDW
ncbi:MAG: DUF4468 domain-containing protein [Bacteroidetes bacterium]|nr:DUF4468 domain-containing protein [Bacteroidota bacterium]